MEIKAVALDLDGTLLNSKKEVTEKTMKVLKQLKNNGILIIISTGRPYSSIKNLLKELGIEGMVICYNGAKVVNFENDSTIFEIPLEEEYVKRLIEISREEKVHLNLYQDDIWYVEDDENAESQKYKLLTKLIPQKKDFESFDSYEMTKTLYVGENKKLKEIEKILKEEFGNEVYLAFSQKFLLEILNKKVNKGSALLYVLEQYGISKDECMAFGDAINDIEMLTCVKYGIAMGNAMDEVKKIARDITKSNDEDGVAKYILDHIKMG
ncbi:HAD family hydrolase [Cetobacterium ceti]